MYLSVCLAMLCATPLCLHMAFELCRSSKVCWEGKTDRGEQMYACTGSLIETWGALCGGDKGVICEKAAGSLKDDIRDDEMNRQERWSRNGGKLQCSRGKTCLKLGVSFLTVSPPKSVVLVNFGPCAALVQRRALGDNSAQLCPNHLLLSLPQ